MPRASKLPPPGEPLTKREMEQLLTAGAGRGVFGEGSLKGRQVFDDPDRSQRGRTITHAFYFEFTSGDLPAVRGSDDAARARWVPLAEARRLREHLFEDHFFILEHFLGTA